MRKRIRLLGIFWIMGFSVTQAQTENSPYSRYGLGDLLPPGNIVSRGMGGIAAADSNRFSINSLNPATYSSLLYTTFDFGIEIDSRTLRTIDPPRKFSSVSPMISYIQLGIPLNKKRTWGMNFGLRPITRINYKLEKSEKINGDSIFTLFEGRGGSHEVFAGTGVAIKKFSVGINLGYMFGSRDYSSRRSFLNDTVLFYKSNHQTMSNYHGFLLNGGIQYGTKLNKNMWVRVGAFGNMQQNFKGAKDIIRETFDYNSDGTFTIDSVFADKNIPGDLKYPSSYGFGFLIDRENKWKFGADLRMANWDNYSFFNEKELVQNSWSVHFGGQIIPNALKGKSYWTLVAYRLGFAYGKDYLQVDNNLPVWTFTLGAGFPMRRTYQSNQVSIINMGLEFGQRGNKQNALRENLFRFSLGFSLSDLWFRKYQYQ